MRAIDADELLEKIDRDIEKAREIGFYNILAGFKVSEALVVKAQTIGDGNESEAVKHGHWIHWNTFGENRLMMCSACDFIVEETEINKIFNFTRCPRCWAIMDERRKKE